MMGVVTEVPFPTYPGGFPPEVVEQFTKITGKPPLGNVPASGTEIIEELGAAHMESGRPILYTSADSVFQIAAHEEVVPLERLYEWSARAREMLGPPHDVNRVIARPFRGRPGAFWRTPNRRDYAIEPPPNLLDELRAGDIEVHAVGKDFGHLLWTRDYRIDTRSRQSRSNGEDVRVARDRLTAVSSSRISTTLIRSTVIAATSAATATL